MFLSIIYDFNACNFSLSAVMPQKTGRLLAVFLFLFVAQLNEPATAGEASLTQEQLETQINALESEIKAHRETLKSTRDERSGLEKNLEDNEKEIGDLLKKIEAIKSELKKDNRKVEALQQRKQALEDSKREQQQLIVQHIRAAYEIGKQEYLKVILNQKDPYQMARMLTYYDYFNRARVAEVTAFNNTISDLAAVERQLVAERQKLSFDKDRLEKQHGSLLAAQSKRKLALVDLDRLIASTGSSLQNRLENREYLERLLQKITPNITNLPDPEEILPFASLKGKLYLPAAGTILKKFGNPRNTGQLKWNGVYITAEAGTPVHAVHFGRVVFSDWLRGFGLLLIISHGEGYMSLYGHNQLLYRETGDWVAAGEIVARVGNSGGQKQSGLYFEVRQSGKPADPQLWCQARPPDTA